MKKEVIFLVVISILSFISAVSISEDLHLNIQTTNSSGGVVTGTFTFDFNISDASDCSSVVYHNRTSLTTDSRGIISYYLPEVSLDYDLQYWLCHYRDGSLINISQIARSPYAFRARNVSLGGVIADTNYDFNLYNLSNMGHVGIGIDMHSLTSLLINNGDLVGLKVYGTKAIWAIATTGLAVQAVSNSGNAVDAFSSSGRGLWASSDSDYGVYAQSTTGTGGYFKSTLGKSLVTGTGDVMFDSSTFYLNATSNYVGIGTATPLQPLDIVGNVNISYGNLTINQGGNYIVSPDEFAFQLGGYTFAGLYFNITSIGYEFLNTDGARNAFIGAGVATDESWIKKLSLGGDDQFLSSSLALNVNGSSNFTGDVVVNGINVTQWLYNQTSASSGGSYNETYHGLNVSYNKFWYNQTVGSIVYISASSTNLQSNISAVNTSLIARFGATEGNLTWNETRANGLYSSVDYNYNATIGSIVYISTASGNLQSNISAVNTSLMDRYDDYNYNQSDAEQLGGYDSTYFMPLNTSVSGDFDFNGGWLEDGLSIIDGDIYAQTGYFYNISSLNVTKQNLTVIEDMNIFGNLNVTGQIRIGSKIVSDWMYNQTYTEGTYNATYHGLNVSYNKWWYNMTDTIYNYNMTVDSNFDYNMSLWNISGGNIYQKDLSFNVGIGTNTPQQDLNVVGDGNFTEDVFIGGNLNISENVEIIGADGNFLKLADGVELFFGDDQDGGIRYNQGTETFEIELNVADKNIDFSVNRGGSLDTPVMILDGQTAGVTILNNFSVQDGFVDFKSGTFHLNPTTGYVGIGTNTPQQELNVVGDLNVTEDIILNGNIYVDTGKVGIGNISGAKFTITTPGSNDIVTSGTGIYVNVSGVGLKIVDGSIGFQSSGADLYNAQYICDDCVASIDTRNSGNGFGIYVTSALGTAGYFDSNGGYAIITDDGNVGIGMTDPTSLLNVNGETNITGNFMISSGNYLVGNNEFAFVAEADNDAGLRFDVSNIMFDFVNGDGLETASIGAGGASHESWIKQLVVGDTLHTSEVYDFEVDGISNFTGDVDILGDVHILNGNLTLDVGSALQLEIGQFAFQSLDFPNIGLLFNGTSFTFDFRQSNGLKNFLVGAATTVNSTWARRSAIGEGDPFSPAYPLEVKGNKSGISIYAEHEISAQDYIDHTKFPDEDYEAIDKIKLISSDGKGELDHSTLPENVKKNYQKPIYKTKIDSKTGEPYDEIIGYEDVEGRSLGSMISVNTKALQEMIEKIELLESKVDDLEKNKK